MPAIPTTPSLAHTPGSALVRTVFRWLLRILYRVRIAGDIAALDQGSRLVVARCESVLDGVLLGLFLPRNPLVVTTAEMHESRLTRWLLRWVSCCNIREGHPLPLKGVVHHVRAGGVAVMFPQGAVAANRGPMPVGEAAGMLAAHCGREVVPVRISGTLYSHHARTSLQWPRRFFPQVTITVNVPVQIAHHNAASAKSRRQAYAGTLQTVLQEQSSHTLAQRSLFDAFVDAVDLYGRHTPIAEDVRRQPVSYGQLLKEALALGRVLARETAAGETVGVLMPSTATTLSLVLGLTAQGRVAAMLNYSAGMAAMHGACITAGVRTVVTSDQFLAALGMRNIAQRFHGIRVIIAETLPQSLTLSDKLWLAAFALWRPRAAVTRVDSRQPAVVLFTSGSEGTPKGVVLSHAAMLANMAQLGSAIDFGPDDKFFSALPLYHIFGLVACSLMPLMTGTRLFLYVSPLRYRAIPALIGECRATYLFGTSTFLGHYARQARLDDYRSLRKVICGGEKLNAEVERLWRDKYGLVILEGYGATECGPAMALNTPLAFRHQSVGRFLPRIEYRVMAVPGIDEGGVLHVRGPNLMSGYLYHDRPGILVPPRSAAGEGWHDTGDIVKVDAQGYVTVVGRIRRFAKIAGEMVSLDAVERVALRASPHHHHAAILAQVPGQGEGIWLFTTDTTLERVSLLQAARLCGVSPLAAPRRIQRLAQLPQLGNGKTDYLALQHSLNPGDVAAAH